MPRSENERKVPKRSRSLPPGQKHKLMSRRRKPQADVQEGEGVDSTQPDNQELPDSNATTTTTATKVEAINTPNVARRRAVASGRPVGDAGGQGFRPRQKSEESGSTSSGSEVEFPFGPEGAAASLHGLLFALRAAQLAEAVRRAEEAEARKGAEGETGWDHIAQEEAQRTDEHHNHRRTGRARRRHRNAEPRQHQDWRNQVRPEADSAVGVSVSPSKRKRSRPSSRRATTGMFGSSSSSSGTLSPASTSTTVDSDSVAYLADLDSKHYQKILVGALNLTFPLKGGVQWDNSAVTTTETVSTSALIGKLPFGELRREAVDTSGSISYLFHTDTKQKSNFTQLIGNRNPLYFEFLFIAYVTKLECVQKGIDPRINVDKIFPPGDKKAEKECLRAFKKVFGSKNVHYQSPIQEPDNGAGVNLTVEDPTGNRVDTSKLVKPEDFRVPSPSR